MVSMEIQKLKQWPKFCSPLGRKGKSDKRFRTSTYDMHAEWNDCSQKLKNKICLFKLAAKLYELFLTFCNVRNERRYIKFNENCHMLPKQENIWEAFQLLHYLCRR